MKIEKCLRELLLAGARLVQSAKRNALNFVVAPKPFTVDVAEGFSSMAIKLLYVVALCKDGDSARDLLDHCIV